MINYLLFFIQIFIIVSVGFFFARLSSIWLTSWITLLTLCMNIFFMKQIELFGLSITAADMYFIGLLVCINLFREFHSLKEASKLLTISYVITIAFMIFTFIHLKLQPSIQDYSQKHFEALFSSSLRVCAASVIVLAISQYLELCFYNFLKIRYHILSLPVRSAISISLTQILDTVLFSFLGLYGIVHNITDIIMMSIISKLIILLGSTVVLYLIKQTKTNKNILVKNR